MVREGNQTSRGDQRDPGIQVGRDAAISAWKVCPVAQWRMPSCCAPPPAPKIFRDVNLRAAKRMTSMAERLGEPPG